MPRVSRVCFGSASRSMRRTGRRCSEQIEADRSEKAAAKAADKDGNDLDAVAGNAEDDIGDLIANIREKELLFGEQSLLKVYGPMVSSICASPKRYRVCLCQRIDHEMTRRRLNQTVIHDPLTCHSRPSCAKRRPSLSPNSCASLRSSASSTYCCSSGSSSPVGIPWSGVIS